MPALEAAHGALCLGPEGSVGGDAELALQRAHPAAAAGAATLGAPAARAPST